MTTLTKIFILLTVALCFLSLSGSTDAKDESVRPKNFRLKLPEIFNWSKFKVSLLHLLGGHFIDMKPWQL